MRPLSAGIGAIIAGPLQAVVSPFWAFGEISRIVREAIWFDEARLRRAGFVPVATRVGGVPELITDGEDGFLEAVGDIEAQAARVYWSRLFSSFVREDSGDKRNMMLNYGYAALESQVRIAIAEVGLDPSVGYLHVCQPGRQALVYDLMEPYRPQVDRELLAFIRS